MPHRIGSFGDGWTHLEHVRRDTNHMGTVSRIEILIAEAP